MAAQQARRTAVRQPRRSRRSVPLLEWWLHVGGFKSIRDPLDIQLRPLTLFCGGNSSGKTSIIQPLLLLKQTLESAYDPGPLLLSGDNVAFSSVKDMLWRGRGSDVATRMTVGLTDFDGEVTRLSFKKAHLGITLEELAYEPPSDAKDLNAYKLTASSSSRDELWQAVRPEFRSFLQQEERQRTYELRLTRSRCFFHVNIELERELGDEVDRPLTFPATGYGMLVNRATNLIHLPGLRDNPSRFYPATQVGDAFPGVFQPYVASIIASWGDRRDKRLRQLGEQMSQLGLTWKVLARRLDDTRVALHVGRLQRPAQGGAMDLVNIADVGLGVSQTLPVLVALLAANRFQFVYLEQPEIHLHPRAQVALGTLLLESARRGVGVIAETHSYLLLRAIQETAARMGLTHLVKLHWFDRDEKGVTRVESADLDADGSFGDWPVDFSDVELDVEERYLRAALDTE